MFVADLHNDLVQRIIEGEDVTKETSHGHTDIPRLRESCINLQILIIWVSSKSPDVNFFNKANKMFDEIEKLSNVKDVLIPKKLQEIKDGIKDNKLLLPISMEGGEAIENKIQLNLKFEKNYDNRIVFYINLCM